MWEKKACFYVVNNTKRLVNQISFFPPFSLLSSSLGEGEREGTSSPSPSAKLSGLVVVDDDDEFVYGGGGSRSSATSSVGRAGAWTMVSSRIIISSVAVDVL